MRCALRSVQCETRVIGWSFTTPPSRRASLDQIELGFSTLAWGLIPRGNSASLNDFVATLDSFIEYFDRTLTKPLHLAYQGRAPGA
jgi:hypothetical protein